MEQITSSTPGLYWLGTKDVSGGVVNVADTPLPFVRPILFFYSPDGKEGPAWMHTSLLANSYGEEILNYDNEYSTHGTLALNRAIKAQTRCLGWRLRPEDSAPPAKVGIDLEYIKDNIVQYERKADGSYDRDATGALKPTGETAVGYRFAFYAVDVDNDKYGKREGTDGTMTSSIDGEVAKRIPLTDWAAADFGSRGNNYGLRIWAPTVSSALAGSAELNEEVNAFVYRLQLLRRPSFFEAPKIITDKYDAASTYFSFGENVVSEENGGVLLDLDSRVPENWEDDTGEYYMRSKLEGVHIYREELEEVLALFQATESPFGTVPSDPEAIHQVNFISAQTVEDVPYYSLQIEGMASGSIMFTENSSVYLRGGKDGTMSNETFNAQVKAIFDDLEGNRLTNIARYPFNFVIDSGFPLQTKYSIMNVLRARNDSYIAFSTQDITRDPNDAEAEEAIALALLTRLQNHPDSVEFATRAFRGCIVGHTGLLTGIKRKVRAPLSIDWAYKIMAYGAADTGILNPDLAPDTSDDLNYVVTEVKSLNNIDKSWRAKRRLWGNGVIYVEDYDHNNRLFYPGMQSFYPDASSVLNSALVGLCIAQVARYAWQVWRGLTGNQKLKAEQLIERSDAAMTSYVSGTMDGRCEITPHTQVTELDKARGWSWTMPIDVGANGMHTVMSAYVISSRLERASNGQ